MDGDAWRRRPVAEGNQHERDDETTGRSEAVAFHEALDHAGKLYADYLDVAQVGDVARLAYDPQYAVESPPPSNLPLTLEIRTNS